MNKNELFEVVMPSVKNPLLDLLISITDPRPLKGTSVSCDQYDKFRLSISGLPARESFPSTEVERSNAIESFFQKNNIQNIKWKDGDLYDPTAPPAPAPPVPPVVGLNGLGAAPNPVPPPGNYGNPGSFQRKVWISMWLLHDCTGFT